MWHELDSVTLLWKENLIMIDTDIITTQSQHIDILAYSQLANNQ